MKTKRTKKGTHRRVMEFLQSDQFTDLADTVETPVHKNSLGLVTVVLTVSQIYLDELLEPAA
jgi:hypothetical protein